MRFYASFFPCLLSLLSLWSYKDLCWASAGEAVQKPKQISVLLVSSAAHGHIYSMVNLGEELVRRGHNVTLCTTVMDGFDILPKVAERVGMNFLNAGYDNLTMEIFKNMLNRTIENVFDLSWLSYPKWTSIKIRRKLDNVGVNQFDIIVCDYLAAAVGVYFEMQTSKVIIYSPSIPYIPAVIPPWPHTLFSDNPNFFEKVSTTLSYPIINHVIKSFFSGISDMDHSEGFNRILKDTDITAYPGIRMPLFIPSVVGFDFPKTQTPLTHYVGPVLMGTLPSLHPDTEEWLRRKKERSVIYISMGTTSLLTSDTAKAILGGVLSTDYDAIWALRKSKRDILEGLEIDPDRIHLLDWGAQQTVLAHPAIKLSILHCGLNGVQESLYNSVPVICIPYAFDHFEVATKLQRAQVGVPLHVQPQVRMRWFQISAKTPDITVERVRSAIQQVTSSKEIFKNAAKMRKLFMHAGGAQRAADLVEFYEEVGYDHLIPAYAKYEWTWMQYYNVDVYCLLGTILTLWLYVSYRLIKCCVRICCKCGKGQKIKPD